MGAGGSTQDRSADPHNLAALAKSPTHVDVPRALCSSSALFTPALEYVNLNHCMIGDGGIEALACALISASKLKLLCVRGNLATASTSSRFLAQASTTQQKVRSLRVQIGGADGSGSSREGGQPLCGRNLSTDQKIVKNQTTISRLVLRRSKPRDSETETDSREYLVFEMEMTPRDLTPMKMKSGRRSSPARLVWRSPTPDQYQWKVIIPQSKPNPHAEPHDTCTHSNQSVTQPSPNHHLARALLLRHI